MRVIAANIYANLDRIVGLVKGRDMQNKWIADRVTAGKTSGAFIFVFMNLSNNNTVT